jgi:hypothetical protein
MFILKELKVESNLIMERPFRLVFVRSTVRGVPCRRRYCKHAASIATPTTPCVSFFRPPPPH